ncbi:hypothetical protein NRK68_06460 [Streptomyces yangpuensis]|uniref:Excreted virulence factor EspC, type VII ESX diderm n=1 Tax=Streptomyces yangpuensis TaxID=1648182 RepID=A0ABY5PSX6_9ACTN|nr:hypothetical protein [Streptomyces yangpuensis]UUY46888.1 hypothetical protein NRK68_06460 [Streptomyces yangpuensis]
MIDVGKIPTFTGNLGTLETHAAALKTTASGIRGTGKDVHSAFQALDALESVSGALTSFATSARPLVAKMKQLRVDAEKFVADHKNDEDCQQDQGKIDENAGARGRCDVGGVPWRRVRRRQQDHHPGLGVRPTSASTRVCARREWTKDNVGSDLEGFFVDGVWGTLPGRD